MLPRRPIRAYPASARLPRPISSVCAATVRRRIPAICSNSATIGEDAQPKLQLSCRGGAQRVWAALAINPRVNGFAVRSGGPRRSRGVSKGPVYRAFCIPVTRLVLAVGTQSRGIGCQRGCQLFTLRDERAAYRFVLECDFCKNSGQNNSTVESKYKPQS